MKKTKQESPKKHKNPSQKLTKTLPSHKGSEEGHHASINTPLSSKATGKPPQPICTFSSCKRPYRAKGYCGFHYKEWRQGKFGKARYKKCSDGMCTQKSMYNRHGYCEKHYQDYYIKGLESKGPQVKKEETPSKTKAA